MRYRVDALAARAGVSVDTVRFYQAKGLLRPPERDGRLAYYSETHREALGRIRDLKAKGFSLASIRRLLAGELDPADEALTAALVAPEAGGADPGEWLTIEQLVDRTGVSAGLLRSIEREGLLTARTRAGVPHYSGSDAAAVEAGLALLEAGLPLSELLALARDYDRAMEPIAERAADLFDVFVRRPAIGEAGAEAGGRLVGAFERMFAAATALVGHRFGRLLLEIARDRIEGVEETAGSARAEGAWRA
jgi:DNA-binding transcriptional MerR regulator